MSLRILFGDITEEKVDVIVNPTDHWYSGGGGTDYAVHQAAGYELETELEALPTLCTGDVSVTDAYDLQARYIFHTAGPRWKGGHHHEATLLRSCYTTALMKAIELDCHSIAFPLIASGTFRFPSDYASSIAMETITNFLKLAPELEVHLVIYPKGPAVGLFEDLGEYIAKHFTGHFVPQMEEPEYQPEDVFSAKTSFSSGACGAPLRRTSKEKATYRRRANAALEERIERRTAEVCYEEEDETDLPEVPESIPDLTEETSFNDDLILEKKKSVPLADSRIPQWTPDDTKKPEAEDGVSRVLMGYVNQYLEEHPDEKESDIYKRALLTRAHYSKVKSELVQPRKYTILALAFSLRLSKKEVERLLLSAGLALTGSSTGDIIVNYFLEKGIYDIHLINGYLFSCDAQLLGPGK